MDPIIHLLTNSKLVLRGLRRLYCNDLLNLPKIRHAMGLRQTCKTSQLRNYVKKNDGNSWLRAWLSGDWHLGLSATPFDKGSTVLLSNFRIV